MDYPKRSRFAGTFLAMTAVVAVVFTTSAVLADSVATVNGVDIDTTTFDFYLRNRTQRTPTEVTAEERELVLQELKDIYALTTQPRATELADDPTLKAQIEIQYRAALAQAVATDWLTSNPASDDEIQAAYDAQMLATPEYQYKARHILVETQAAAIDLITQLDAGASFVELAQTHSTGPSGPTGGDLGWFSPGQMVAPFSDAVELLENGAHTKTPVQTEFGWHVILREESRINEPPPLDSVRETLKQSVEQTKFQEYLEGLRVTDVD